MITSFDKLNINNNQDSKNINNLTIDNKTINLENEYFNIKNNTANNFYLKNENNILNKTLKVIRPNYNNKNNLDNNDRMNNNINNNLSSFLKELDFNNLNEYYELQSSIFLKKIQKLNLKFYWTCEVFLNDKNIQYPYNKLFLILFKEISLYIEEIERLNKQLKLKTKNEKYYIQKLSKLTEKEKQYLINSQKLKNIQRNYNILLKSNDKYKNNIEKLNKKINFYANTNKLNKNIIKSNNINECKSLFGNQTMINTTLDSINTPNSLILNSSQKSKKIKKKISNKKKDIKDDNINEIIKTGIEQCDEELRNLSKIEELLIFKSKKKHKVLTRFNSRNKIKCKLFNKTIK